MVDMKKAEGGFTTDLDLKALIENHSKQKSTNLRSLHSHGDLHLLVLLFNSSLSTPCFSIPILHVLLLYSWNPYFNEDSVIQQKCADRLPSAKNYSGHSKQNFSFFSVLWSIDCG